MNKKSEFTFSGFLCGTPQGDYIFQNADYAEQIRRAVEILRESDYILIGAGAGLSTAAGAEYGGKWFEENFAEFRERYGTGPHMQDMYSAGFYPFPDEEAFWGYWSKHALLGGVKLDVTPLHKVLLSMCEGKKLFVLSTNVDGQFVKAGLPADQIFCTQGDYFHIQCARGCHQKVYDAAELFMQMDEARKDCRIPSDLVPKCPVCGGPMNMNLRSDNYFVEDSAWHEAERRFGDFLSEAAASGKRVCLLEVGVGFNTPIIIRFPFEKLAKDHEQMSLVRLNLKEAFVPAGLGDRAVGINADMARSIEDIAAYSRLEKMQQLRDELLAVEEDRIEGRGGCTIDELDAYLDDVIAIDEIRLLILPIVRKYDISRVVLFGSYARGDATCGSDVDLLIECSSIRNMEDYLDLQEDLKSALGKNVDLIMADALQSDTTRAAKRLIDNIEIDNVIIYEKKK